MTDEFGAFNPFDETDDKNPEQEESINDHSGEESLNNLSHQKKVEQADQAKLDEIENEYKELDKDLVDINDDEEDTLWLIQNVGVSILKIIGILAILGLVLWSIWGGGPSSKEKPKIVAKEAEKLILNKNTTKKPDLSKSSSVKEKKTSQGFFSKLFSGGKETKSSSNSKKKNNSKLPSQNIKNSEQKPINKIDTKTIAIDKNPAKNFQPNLASVQIMAWNYWLEKERLLGQKNTPGEVALWTKDTESLFEIPFIEQIRGKSDFEREKKLNNLMLNSTKLLQRSENLKVKLQAEIKEYKRKEEKSIKEATKYEQMFLNAMNKSDPVGIDQYLAKKIAAEKKQLENGIEKESRQYLVEKVESYSQVLMNLREYLVANRQALIKDVQVVQFPEDPFNRIVPFQTWEQMKMNDK